VTRRPIALGTKTYVGLKCGEHTCVEDTPIAMETADAYGANGGLW
jgi:hypothetical protein